ncbi:hypothetical protein ACH5RR_015830 [Cinchona calisaya]|uniref:Uncharacterized protein n=1 Tax=Cinchona calisaya TaxID=153742 RepID=A0ABD2ZUA5_9GENT
MLEVLIFRTQTCYDQRRSRGTKFTALVVIEVGKGSMEFLTLKAEVVIGEDQELEDGFEREGFFIQGDDVDPIGEILVKPSMEKWWRPEAKQQGKGGGGVRRRKGNCSRGNRDTREET